MGKIEMRAIMDITIFILKDTYNKSTSLDSIANSINYPIEMINEILMNLNSKNLIEYINENKHQDLKATGKSFSRANELSRSELRRTN